MDQDVPPAPGACLRLPPPEPQKILLWHDSPMFYTARLFGRTRLFLRIDQGTSGEEELIATPGPGLLAALDAADERWDDAQRAALLQGPHFHLAFTYGETTCTITAPGCPRDLAGLVSRATGPLSGHETARLCAGFGTGA